MNSQGVTPGMILQRSWLVRPDGDVYAGLAGLGAILLLAVGLYFRLEQPTALEGVGARYGVPVASLDAALSPVEGVERRR